MKNKIVIVTGASSGIGKATALRFAQKGAHLVLAARSVAKLNILSEQLTPFGIEVLIVPTDVSKEADCQNLMNKALEKFGRIDVPLGQVIRLLRGETNLPLSGGPDLLRAIYFEKKEDTYQAIAGDCYFQLVEWSSEGDLNAWSIHQYGASTANKSSKHYDSQSSTFSKHQMKQIRPLSDTSFLNLKQK